MNHTMNEAQYRAAQERIAARRARRGEQPEEDLTTPREIVGATIAVIGFFLVVGAAGGLEHDLVDFAGFMSNLGWSLVVLLGGLLIVKS